MAITRLRKVQVGVESSSAPGTEVAATTKLYFVGELNDNVTVVFPEENAGTMFSRNRTYIPKAESQITLTGSLTYQQLPVFCMASIAESTSGDADGSAYSYTYDFPALTANSFNTFTMEVGNDQVCYESTYCFVQSFTITGRPGESWQVSANIIGRQANSSSFTDLSSVWPHVEDILFGKTLLYIDNNTTYPATTQYANAFLGFEFTYDSGIRAKYSGDGSISFGYARMKDPSATLKVSLEQDSTSGVAEHANYVAGTERSIRIKATGSASGGTTYTTQTAIIDMCGFWESFDPPDSVDGDDVVTGTMRCVYNTLTEAAGRVIVGTDISGAPSST